MQGPDLHVELIHLSGFQRLLLVVGVIGTVFFGELRIELSVGSPQPALADGGVRVERSLEDDFL